MKIRLLVLALSLTGAYLVYQESQAPLPTAPPSGPRVRAELRLIQEQPAVPYQPPTLDQFTQLIERPPFSPTRRPPPEPMTQAVDSEEDPPPSESKVSPMQAPDFQLVGVMIDPDKQIALVRVPGDVEFKRLSRGDEVAGWLVEAILPKHIVLSSQESVFELKLEELKGPATAAPVFQIQRSSIQKVPNMGGAVKP